MSRARHLFIRGDLPHPEYEENKTTLQDQIEVGQKELSKVENLDVEIECVEKLRRTLMSIEDPLSGHYAFIIDEESDIDLLENENDFKYGFGYGSRKLAAKRR